MTDALAPMPPQLKHVGAAGRQLALLSTEPLLVLPSTERPFTHRQPSLEEPTSEGGELAVQWSSLPPPGVPPPDTLGPRFLVVEEEGLGPCVEGCLTASTH